MPTFLLEWGMTPISCKNQSPASEEQLRSLVNSKKWSLRSLVLGWCMRPVHAAVCHGASRNLRQTMVSAGRGELSLPPPVSTAVTPRRCWAPALGTAAGDHLRYLAHLHTFPELALHRLLLRGCNLVLNFCFHHKQFSNCSRVRESNLIAQNSKLSQATHNDNFAQVIFRKACFWKEQSVDRSYCLAVRVHRSYFSSRNQPLH